MWVSIDSEAACSAALQQAFLRYGIVDTDALQLVLESDGAGLARALCIRLFKRHRLRRRLRLQLPSKQP